MCVWTFSRLRKKCTKSLYVYVCVLEHNASTLDKWKKGKKVKEWPRVWRRGSKRNFLSHVFRALTIRIGMRPKVHYGRSDMTCCALAVCFVFLQLALVCASLLSRVEEHGDISSLLGYRHVSLQQGLTDIWLKTLVLREQSCPMLTWTISVMLW